LSGADELGRVIVRPERYRQFGAPEGASFYLVTNPDLLDRFVIHAGSLYRRTEKLGFDAGDSVEDLLQAVPDRAHLLVISPGWLFSSPTPDQLGPDRKLVAMPSNSTPTSLEAIAHFLEAMERTDPGAQQAFADRFFEVAESSDQLEIIDDRHQTRAVFQHLAADYEWNLQAGVLDWGGQQIAPGGEISALPAQVMRFDPNLRLQIEGELALCGQPIVHSGMPSFSRGDQARLYERLATAREHAVVATVRGGVVAEVRPTHPDAGPAAGMLESLFQVDSRYRVIWELGIGINTALSLLPGNLGMNEVYGGTNGTVHCGFGLTPFTQYAIIVLCPLTRLCGRDGSVLAGPPATGPEGGKRRIIRRTTAACACYT
jgi:hypothetical protein